MAPVMKALATFLVVILVCVERNGLVESSASTAGAAPASYGGSTTSPDSSKQGSWLNWFSKIEKEGDEEKSKKNEAPAKRKQKPKQKEKMENEKKQRKPKEERFKNPFKRVEKAKPPSAEKNVTAEDEQHQQPSEDAKHNATTTVKESSMPLLIKGVEKKKDLENKNNSEQEPKPKQKEKIENEKNLLERFFKPFNREKAKPPSAEKNVTAEDEQQQQQQQQQQPSGDTKHNATTTVEESSNPSIIDPTQNTTTTNETTSVPSSPEMPSLLPEQNKEEQQQQSTGIIVIGGSPNGPVPHRYYRRQIPGLLDQQQQQQKHLPSQALPQNSVLIIELAASVLATLTRLWLLRSVAGWLAKQEESMQPTQHFVFERLNDRYVRDAAALKTSVQSPPDGIPKGQWRRRHVWKAQGRAPERPQDFATMFTKTVIVVELKTDTKDGPDNDYLQDIVSFLLQQHRRQAFGTHKESRLPMDLEVVFLVTSPGGSVASFGLAAAQVQRLAKEKGITTTVCVDKYAASGGYMIASQAHRLIASPFASVGSIGVIMEGLNFYEIAKRYGIQPLVIKAGNSKNPFTTFGEVSRRDVDVEKEHLERVHKAFQDVVMQGRPGLKNNINQIADGSVFLGSEALELEMVDRVMTSSEYIQERVEAGDRVLQLHRSNPSRFHRRALLSPLDVLPHLRSWISGKALLAHQHHSQPGTDSSPMLLSWLVRAGGLLGFLHHVYCQYFSSRGG